MYRATSIFGRILLKAAALAALIAGTGALRAQPEAELREALDALYKAGNYSWTLLTEAERPDGLLYVGRPEGYGKTIIGKYTTANINGIPVVFSGRDAVWKLKESWRHASELDQRRTLPPAPHEIISSLMAFATGAHLRGNIIAVTIQRQLRPPSIEHFIRTGTPLHDGGIFRSPLGSPIATWKVEMLCSIVQGQLAGVTVEAAYTWPNTRRTSYIIEIFDIGTTTVEVDPEAEAILSVSTSRR